MTWHHHKDIEPTARKPHICCLCELEISPGTKYTRRHGVEDGEGWRNFAMHSQCADMALDWNENEWATYEPINVREDLARLGEALERLLEADDAGRLDGEGGGLE
jgi:hypothetical protein